MLEKPDIQDAAIIACLRGEYGLKIVRVDFLPLGADQDTAVYRAATDDATRYFVKLRGGVFDELTLIVPRILHDQGIRHVIPPMFTRSRQLWAQLGDFRLAVFPFIEGHNGYQADLRDHHWVAFGRALKMIHTAEMTPAVTDRIRREDYSGAWREIVRRFLKRVEDAPFRDPVAAELAAFFKTKQSEINRLIRRAEYLASVLQARTPHFILCHGDIHAGNILIDAHDDFYIVDWDTLILAPKERDLMFVGGGQFLNKRTADAEEALFYQGYGQSQTDPVALAYYRYERIVQDIAAFGEQILMRDDGGEDRENGLRLLMSQFLPHNVVEIAFQSEKALPLEHRAE